MGEERIYKARAVNAECRCVMWFCSANDDYWYEVDGPEFQSLAHIDALIDAGETPLHRREIEADYRNLEYYGSESAASAIALGAEETRLREHAEKVRRRLSGAA